MARQKAVSKTLRDSVRRFVRTILSIKAPVYFFHQTLTFAPKQYDEKEAKRTLKKFLENDFIEGVVYSTHMHRDKGFHFHLLLCYYGKPPFSPSTLWKKLRQAILTSWQSYQSKPLNTSRNRLKIHPAPNLDSVWYLTKEIRAGTKERLSGRPIFGTWKNELLPRVPVLKGDVKAWMRVLFPHSPKRAIWNRRKFDRYKRSKQEASLDPQREWKDHIADIMNKDASDDEFFFFLKKRHQEFNQRKISDPFSPAYRRYTDADLKREKATIEFAVDYSGGPDWSEWKKEEVGTEKAVSDDAFKKFRTQQSKEGKCSLWFCPPDSRGAL